MSYSLLGTPRRKSTKSDPYRLVPLKREPVSAKLKNELKAKVKGYCMRCKTPLRGFTPHVHHLNMKPRDNRISNLTLICPTCHAKYHREKSKVVVSRGLFGETKHKVITRDQKKRRKKVGYSLLGEPMYKYKKKSSQKKKKLKNTKKKKTRSNNSIFNFRF